MAVLAQFHPRAKIPPPTNHTSEQNMTDSSRPETAQAARRNSSDEKGAGTSRGRSPSSPSPRDDIIAALLTAASRQYTPIVPSPLNPTAPFSSSAAAVTSEETHGGDVRLERRAGPHYRPRRTRPSVRRPPEISPTLRLLRRKAASALQAHERTATCPSCLQQQQGSEVSAAPSHRGASGEAAESEGSGVFMPTLIVESGPCSLIQIVRWDYVGRDGVSDIEKQTGAGLPLFRPSQGTRHGLQLLIILISISACFTFFTVLGLDALRFSHYLAG